MATTTDQPTAARHLDTPAARELSDLASIFDDLQTVLRCCERLISELAAGEPDPLVVEALWTTAVLSYSRCFADGRSGAALTEQDVSTTQLQGQVLEWHKVLRQMRKHYADPADNPRERFSVGVTQDSEGRASGIAITSAPQPTLDEVTVRQTGALAYELSQLVDQRITEHQERARDVVNTMSREELDKLPLIELSDHTAA
jgi:hypothetical protein